MADNWTSDINGVEDEDEALRIAIAMSLGQDPANADRKKADKTDAIDLTQDESSSSCTPGQSATLSPNEPSMTTAGASTSSFSALGIDRKKMEEERLARLKKRKAQELGDVDSVLPRQRQKVESKVVSAPTSTLLDSTPPLRKIQAADTQSAPRVAAASESNPIAPLPSRCCEEDLGLRSSTAG